MNIDKINLIQRFKNRELKAKNIFNIKRIEKNLAYDFIKKFHYLQEAKFFSKFSYGLFVGEELCGCSTFSNPQGIKTLQSWFGLDNTDQSVLELSRLCMLPELNGSNATSYLLGRSLRELKKVDVRAVISLADSVRHNGAIYQVCNFKYYGLTDYKTDFYTEDGRLNPRGQTAGVFGVWLPRTRKHRYMYMVDNKIEVLLEEEIKPKLNFREYRDCCKDTKVVFDKRYNKYYKCPICGGFDSKGLKIISYEGVYTPNYDWGDL